MKQETLSKLVDETVAGEYLGLQLQTLRNWRIAGKGPRFYKVGGRAVRYRLSDLDAFIEAGAVGGNSGPSAA